MAGNLEDFLKKAAEQLADQVAGKPVPKPANRPDVRHAERAGVDTSHYEDEVPEAILVTDGPDPLSSIDTRRLPSQEAPQLAEEISMADERMQERMHQALDHDLLDLPDASGALEGVHPQDIAHSGSSSVRRRRRDVSPLIKLLRNPDSLRAAYMLSQIFDRKKF